MKVNEWLVKADEVTNNKFFLEVENRFPRMRHVEIDNNGFLACYSSHHETIFYSRKEVKEIFTWLQEIGYFDEE